MRDYLKLPTILSLMSLSLIFVTPAQAQRSAPCSNDNQEQPSQARRQITNEEYGLRFEIPANYRTELRRETDSRQRLSIAVRNPTDVAFLDCAIRNRMRGAGHQVSDVSVSIEPRPRHIRNVRDILRETESSMARIQSDVVDASFSQIGGQEAVIYTIQSNPRRGITSRSRFATLIHPNQQSLVTVYAGDYGFSISAIDLEVMDMIMSSFRIDR